MDKKIVENPSEYWHSFEAEQAVYYKLKWRLQSDLKHLIDGQKKFFELYIKLCNKYRLAIPISEVFPELAVSNQKFAETAEELRSKFYNLYSYHGKIIYPSSLYFQKGQAQKLIVDMDPVTSFEDLQEIISSPPVKVELFLSSFDDTLSVLISFDHDAFFAEVDNKKTKNDPETFPDETWMDNNFSAIHNGARFNHFLKDIRMLCSDFGMSFEDFECTFMEDDIDKDGIVLN